MSECVSVCIWSSCCLASIFYPILIFTLLVFCHRLSFPFDVFNIERQCENYQIFSLLIRIGNGQNRETEWRNYLYTHSHIEFILYVFECKPCINFIRRLRHMHTQIHIYGWKTWEKCWQCYKYIDFCVYFH